MGRSHMSLVEQYHLRQTCGAEQMKLPMKSCEVDYTMRETTERKQETQMIKQI